MKPLRIQALPAGEVVKLEDVGGPGTWALEVEVEGHPFNARTVLDAQGAATLAQGALHWLDVHDPERLEKLLLEGPYPTAIRIRGATALTEELNAARDVLTAAGVHGDDLSLPLRIKALANERDKFATDLVASVARTPTLRAIQDALDAVGLWPGGMPIVEQITTLAKERDAARAELAAIRDAVVTDNAGDDDGWPTSLDAVKAALASWSIALKDSQDESSKLATQRNSARAERDKALADLDRRDTESGRLLRDVEDLGGRLQAAQIEADTARRLLGEVLVQAMLRGAVLTLPDKTEQAPQAGEVDRARVGVPRG